MTVLYPYDYNDVHQLSARNFSSSITPNATQRTTLIVVVCYILIIGILWYALSLFLPLLVHYRAPHECMNGCLQAPAVFEDYQ
jgi:hypothetical protein